MVFYQIYNRNSYKYERVEHDLKILIENCNSIEFEE